jgi:predicted nucleotidyltransferase
LITKTILKAAPITQMVILFGSHARGDWIEDVTIEANATYEYRSDYDILIVVPSQNITYQASTWHNVKRKIRELQLNTVYLQSL